VVFLNDSKFTRAKFLDSKFLEIFRASEASLEKKPVKNDEKIEKKS